MNDREILKSILEIIDGLKYGETISIEELIEKTNIEEKMVMKELMLALKFRILYIEGKQWFGDAPKLEKHNRIASLECDGIVILDLLRNPELLKQIFSNYPELSNCNIYTIFYFFRRYF